MRALGEGLVVVFAIIGAALSVQRLTGHYASPLKAAPAAHVGIMVHGVDTTAKTFEEVLRPTCDVGPLT